MGEIAYDDVAAASNAAQLYRMEDLDQTTSDGEGGNTTVYYWQAEVGSPVDATIQVTGETKEEAQENLTNAAWGIIQNRQAAAEAAATPPPDAKAEIQEEEPDAQEAETESE